MSLHRWPKPLFNAISMIYTCNSKNKHLRWLSFVHNVFTDYGFDHVFENIPIKG